MTPVHGREVEVRGGLAPAAGVRDVAQLAQELREMAQRPLRRRVAWRGKRVVVDLHEQAVDTDGGGSARDRRYEFSVSAGAHIASRVNAAAREL